MIIKKIIIPILCGLVICALIVLAYSLGYKKSETEFKQRMQIVENHVARMFDASDLTDEEKIQVKELELDTERKIKEFTDLLGKDVNPKQRSKDDNH